MKAALRHHATPTAVGSTRGLKPAPLALLPPIPLYRRLFRTHRKFLPKEMRLLGDEYIKSEFRAHQNIENPMHIVNDQVFEYRCGVDADGFLDWLSNRMANVRSEDRRRFLARREAR